MPLRDPQAQERFDAAMDAVWGSGSHLQDDPAWQNPYSGGLSVWAYRKDPRAITEPGTLVTDAQVQAWVAEDEFIREGLSPQTQRALTYLGTFNPQRGRAISSGQRAAGGGVTTMDKPKEARRG